MTNGFADSPWWETMYDDLVAEILLANRNPSEIAAISSFLVHQLELSPGNIVFDQCCGIGTLSIELAKHDIRVIGNDQSEAYIQRATRDAGSLPCTFFAEDGTTFRPTQSCDAAFNWGTSFGNHLADADNQRMLDRAFEATKPNGRFLLDYQHFPRVLRHLQHTLTHRLQTPEGDVLLLRESTVDLPAGAMRQRWTFIMPDGRRNERTSLVRLYLPHELARFLNTSGFVDVSYYGGVQGEPLTLDSQRCMLVARRPS